MKCDECPHKRYHLNNLERRRKWYEKSKERLKKLNYYNWMDKKEVKDEQR